jgi:hypothetical protein
VIDTRKIDGFDMQGYMAHGDTERRGESPHWVAQADSRVVFFYTGYQGYWTS